MMRQVLRRSGFLPFAGSGAARRASASWLRSWWRNSASSSPPMAETAETKPPQGASCSGLPIDPASPVAFSPPARRLLLRDFIQQSLYHPTRGYFNRDTPVVGHMERPINYWKVYCKEEWNIVVNKQYKDLAVSFLTPVELFTPWYGFILARHMLEHRKHNLGQEGQPLVIFEIGGGNGTLARDILDWLRTNRPEVYEQTQYTCVEISTRLAAQQYESVVTKAGHHHRFKMMRGNAWDRSTWGTREWPHCFILAMEVLDNLPHDKVVRGSGREAWKQTAVCVAPTALGHAPPGDASPGHAAAPSGPASTAPGQEAGGSMETGPWCEVEEELSDPLLGRSLHAVYKPPTFEEKLDKRFNKLLDFILAKEGQREAEGEALFVPTGSMALLETLHDARPNHSIIAADFDHLPDVKIPGKNAPLVAEKVDGINIDHDTLYVPWGKADIFFPTDFDALGRLYRAAADHVWDGQGGGKIETAHYHQGAVMKRYKEMVHTATICAFNPMIDDFLNARFFLGDSYGRHQPGQPGTTAGGLTAPAPGTAAALSDDPAEPGALSGGEALAPPAFPADGAGGGFQVGASTTAIVQPGMVAVAAAAAAVEASRMRLLRQKNQQQLQLKQPVMPDGRGLPSWAQEKLKQHQEVMQRQTEEHAAAGSEEPREGGKK